MSESIEDVVKRLRDRAEARRRSGKLLQIDDRMFDLIADEIEAAVNHQFRGTTKTMPHLHEITKKEEMAVAENATTTPTCDKSSQVGNAAAMREALSDACYAMFNFLKTQYGSCYEEMAKALDKAKSALEKPPRNCDVGTPEEQEERFKRYCPSGDCKRYVCNSYGYEKLFRHKCALIWGQLPYKKEGVK